MKTFEERRARWLAEARIKVREEAERGPRQIKAPPPPTSTAQFTITRDGASAARPWRITGPGSVVWGWAETFEDATAKAQHWASRERERELKR